MLTICEVLEHVDRKNVVSVVQSEYNQVVRYGHSRTIIRHIERDTQVVAYAYNPGNAIVIFPKKAGLIAYGCYFDGFPCGDTFGSFNWSKMKVTEAIEDIKTGIWEKADYLEDINYTNSALRDKWQLMEIGTISHTLNSNRTDIAISQYKRTHTVYTDEFAIYRLCSGKLRVEVNDKHYPYSDFTNLVLFFREHNESCSMQKAPRLHSSYTVLGMSDIDDAILDELKVQSISQKIKQAA